jgi:hypothetical protein
MKGIVRNTFLRQSCGKHGQRMSVMGLNLEKDTGVSFTEPEGKRKQ